MPANSIRLHGFRELDRAFGVADKTLRKELRDAYKDVAEPVRRDAEFLALNEIDNIGVAWSRMRTRVTQRAVWVAPVERGVKTRGRERLRRPNLAPLLLEQMEEALDQNVGEVEDRLEDMLDSVGRAWERA